MKETLSLSWFQWILCGQFYSQEFENLPLDFVEILPIEPICWPKALLTLDIDSIDSFISLF